MKKMIIIIIAIIVGFISIFSIILFVNQQTKIKTGIQFIVVPDDIKIEINDKKYTVNYETIIKLETGNYHIKLSHDNFEPSEQDITVTNNEITKFYITLSPTNSTGEQLINTEIMSFRRETISSYNMNKSSEELEEKYPFIDILPIIKKFFVITPCYGQYGNQPFGVCIMLNIDTNAVREQAKKELLDKGINIDSVPIYFYKG